MLTLLILITIPCYLLGVILLRINRGPLQPTATPTLTSTVTLIPSVTLTPYLTRTASVTPTITNTIPPTSTGTPTWTATVAAPPTQTPTPPDSSEPTATEIVVNPTSNP